MTKRDQQCTAQWVLDQVASVNPYNRQNANTGRESAIYQSGFLAGYLASLMKEDPYIMKRFIRHIEQCPKPK